MGIPGRFLFDSLAPNARWLDDRAKDIGSAAFYDISTRGRNEQYPQDAEENEYRYLSPAWINELAKGLTAGAVKHPGETWRKIPAKEHAWRAVRHCIMWLAGDHSEEHLVNAGMRIMMAWETSREDG